MFLRVAGIAKPHALIRPVALRFQLSSCKVSRRYAQQRSGWG